MKYLLQSLSIATISLSPISNAQDIDLHSDDFSVLRHVGMSYLSKHYPPTPENTPDFGLGYMSHGKQPYPKVGFIGFEIAGAGQGEETLKLQLYKGEGGWKVDRVLDSAKIHQANPTHPYESGHARTDATSKAKVVASKSLEEKLNQEALISNVRSTSMRCYVTKDRTAASCRGIFGVKENNELTCHAQNYLLGIDSGEWKTIRGIEDNQKVDYTSGELINYKPFSMHCG